MSDDTEALPPEAPVEPAPELPPETEAAAPAEPEPELVSHPELDAEQAMAMSLATIGRLLADSNRRIVREQMKVDGVWYSIEVARP